MKKQYVTPGQRQFGLDMEDSLLVNTSLTGGAQSESNMIINDDYQDDSDLWGSI